MVVMLCIAACAQAQTLRSVAANCNFNIGVAVNPNPFVNEPIYANILKNEFNMVVPENELKMGAIKPTENGPFEFGKARNLVNFAKTNNMKVRGHTILWHEGLPDWVKTKAWTKASLLAFLKNYIREMGNEFNNEIEEWDVANEFIQNGNNNILRDGTQSVWMKYIGESVLDSAFKWMRQAFPTAKLYYNDYGAEGMNGKSNGVYALVKRLKERGAPIQGVGFQCHFSYDRLTTYPSDFSNEMDQNIRRLAALGLKISFTEIDFSIPVPFDQGKYDLQAQSYGNLLRIAQANASVVNTFMTWGFTDKHSWIPNFTNFQKGAALLFYTDYTKKPAYHTLMSVLSSHCVASGCSASIVANGPLNFCSGQNVILSANAGVSYKWFKGTAQVGSASTLTVTTSGSYKVEVTQANGCKSTSVDKVITVHAAPAAIISASGSLSFCQGGSVKLNATDGTSYKWFNGTTQVGTAQSYTATTSGLYKVEVANAFGCKTLSSGTQVNAASPALWYRDADGDGKGDANNTLSSCTQPIGYVALAGDACPTDSLKVAPGNCGCNKPENSCVSITGIKGPSCVEIGKTYVYNLTTDVLPLSGIQWWTSNGALVQKTSTDGKQVSVTIPSYAIGNMTLTSGVNMASAPWYKEYVLSIKVGGCPLPTAAKLSVQPHPFVETTVLSLDNQALIQAVILMDMNGLVVYENHHVGSSAVELGKDLSQGIYIAHIYYAEGMVTQKVIKID